MTRKRFIKLLMSKGVQRNGAIRIARAARASGMPYKRVYQTSWGAIPTMVIIMGVIDRLVVAIKAAIDWIVPAIKEIAERVTLQRVAEVDHE